MKTPKVGGLRALATNERSHRRAQRRLGASFTSLRRRYVPLFSLFVGPLAALAVLVAACFTLPFHHYPRQGGSIGFNNPQATHGQPMDYEMRVPVPNASFDWHEMRVIIPAVRKHGDSYALTFWFLVNAALLSLAAAYWIRTLRLCEDRKHRRFLLRLIFVVPAFAGVMAASVIAGSDLGGRVVAATLGTAGVIASALLIATVLGRSASTIALALMVSVMGLMDIFPAWATVATLSGGIAGQYYARFVRNRTSVVRCAACVMAAASVSALIAGIVSGHDAGSAASLAMQALLTGCLGAALWFTLLTVLERPLELTTPLGLLELLDPTRPILERLAREAPGTFAHSLMVGHLAATAAEAIGADPLLCRVAAQYHDLGKLCRAQFFKENQQEGANVHDSLTPSLSALIVNSHVRDGERMAKELKLPPLIQDIITQHHGTTLMQYFYYRASAGATPSATGALQYQFRYPGPKPQTKEAGIMMLADAIEATSRTLGHPTRDGVRGMIDRIVDDRVADHQFDECPLTLQDLSLIRSSLAEAVCAMMHQRIVYPNAISAEPETERQAAAFDFYEDFDPALLLPSPEAPLVVETGPHQARADEDRFVGRRETVRRRIRRRAQRTIN